MSSDRQTMDPAEQVARLYERTEAEAAKASERLVGSGGFTSLLGQMAENVAALTRIGSDTMDLVLRNMRVAGRRDVVRLARQLARTEDKLERVLQEVEALRDRLEELGESSNGARAGTGTSQRNNAGASRRGNAKSVRAQSSETRGEG
jgi:hypothetical protein